MENDIQIENREELFDELYHELEQAKKIADKDSTRVKEDLDLSCGLNKGGWAKGDSNRFGTNRAKMSIPLIPAIIEKVLSTYASSPFGITISPYRKENADKALLLQGVVDGIQNRSRANQAYTNALRSAISCGFGYLHVYTDSPSEKAPVNVCIEALQNPLAVLIDPSAVNPDGSDAEFAAYVTKISKAKAKRLYGIDTDSGNQVTDGMFALFETQYDSERELPLVTIYKKEKDGVIMYRLCGNEFVDLIPLGIKDLPIIRVVGSPIWIRDRREFSYCGICHRAKSVQRLVNYSASQLAERLALSQKANFLAANDAIEAYNDQWEDMANAAAVPALLYDPYDENGRELPMPQQLNTAVNLGDVQGILQNTVSMITITTGLDPNGIFVGTSQMTAEETLAREKQAEAVLATVFQNLANTISMTGRVIVEMLSAYFTDEAERDIVIDKKMSRVKFSAEVEGIIPDEYEVAVDSGPLLTSVRKQNVMVLTELVKVLPAQAQAIVPTLLENLDVEGAENISNAVSKGVINPEDLEKEKVKNAELTEQLAKANQEIVRLQSDMNSKFINMKTQITTHQMDNENRLTLEQMKQQAEDERSMREIISRENMESNRLQNDVMRDITKAQADLERESIKANAQMEAARNVPPNAPDTVVIENNTDPNNPILPLAGYPV